MKFLKLLLFYIFIAFLGYTLRNAIDYYRSSGKYKNENDPTHFEKQLDFQKHLHDRDNKDD